MDPETTKTTDPTLPDHPAFRLPRDVYRQLRRMNKEQANQYLYNVWKSGYETGYQDGKNHRV